MLPSRLRSHPDTGDRFVGRGELDPVPGHRGDKVSAPSGKRAFDHPLPPEGPSFDQSQVLLFDPPFPEELLPWLHQVSPLDNEKTTRSFSVQPVDEEGVLLPRAEVGFQGRDEALGAGNGFPFMNRHPRRFVDNGDILVLKENLHIRFPHGLHCNGPREGCQRIASPASLLPFSRIGYTCIQP
ncbi:MAG: hypothetical protein BWY86_00750 [Candidatus Aminicenantes bacterium ADurb.Bin508]|nr:MAG: hypothetical protein BWY86_00750 [Candidatus Aminicenantes bacterium ADurb.Bin508]